MITVENNTQITIMVHLKMVDLEQSVIHYDYDLRKEDSMYQANMLFNGLKEEEEVITAFFYIGDNLHMFFSKALIIN